MARIRIASFASLPLCGAAIVAALLAAGCAKPAARAPEEAGTGTGAAAGAAAAPSPRGSGVRETAPGDPVEVSVVAVRPSLEPGAMWETYLEPVTDVPVIARADGVIERVLVEEGSRVARGRPVVRLESREQSLEVEYTGALAAQAQAELDRAEKGASGQWISQQTLDAARAKSRAVHADLKLAQLALERRTLRAPVAGVVWQMRARPHRMVRSGEALFRVTDPSRLRAELFLPPATARALQRGGAVRLEPTNEAGGPALAAKVENVSPIADPATGRVRVVLVTSGASASAVGTTVRARFEGGDAGASSDPGAGALGAAGGAVLPRTAALEREGARFFVWRVRDGRIERAPVELGASRSDGYEVMAGLAAGDLVCASGSPLPAAGARVRARLAGDTD